jgi:hypothetical protein
MEERWFEANKLKSWIDLFESEIVVASSHGLKGVMPSFSTLERFGYLLGQFWIRRMGQTISHSTCIHKVWLTIVK